MVGHELGEEGSGGRMGARVRDGGDHDGDARARVTVKREGVAGEEELELRWKATPHLFRHDGFPLI